MRRRVIYCIFNKTVKQLSLEKMFAYYGIVVEYINQDELNNFKFYKNDSIYTIAVLKIINEFIDLNKYQITSKHELLTHVTDKCELSCYTSSNWLCTEVFIAARDGYLLDPIQGKFLSKHSLLVEEINSNKLHSCSQDMAVSQFICKYIYYEKPINLNFNFQHSSRSIDFNVDPADLVLSNKYLLNPIAKTYGNTNLFLQALNSGLFFRSAKNRREKNYWLPGLNAGIPLVPKRDVIHEISYMAHDFNHFLIPDLIFTGNDWLFFRQTYIVYRMMSEAFTLVLTDMMFVDSMFKNGIEYNYTNRKIYPLFQDFNLNLSNNSLFEENILKILHAMTTYCLRGEDQELKTLLRLNKEDNLILFKNKYMQFFVEDFKWTENNYNCLISRKEEMKLWWSLVKPVRIWADLDLETVEEFYSKIKNNSGDIIEKVFKELYQRIIKRLQTLTTEHNVLPFEQRLAKAFSRYMIGQLCLLVHYKTSLPEANTVIKIILDFLYNNKFSITNNNIVFCRNIFEQVLKLLLQRSVITKDDLATFQEVFPLFEPSFAYYDELDDFYDDLSKVSKNILYKFSNNYEYQQV